MAFQINSKKIAKNTITLYLRQIITMLISFFSARITLKQLGINDYGLNNLVGSIVSMFSFINGSMGTAVQRFYNYEIGQDNTNRLKKIFGSGLFLHLIVALLTLVISEFFAIFFLKKLNIPSDRLFAAQIVFQISIATLILGIVTVPYSALLKARELFSQIAIIDIIQAILRLVVLYLLTLFSFDKLILLSLMNFAISLGGIIAFVVMGRKFDETHSLPIYDKSLIKEMIKFVSLLLFTVLSSLLNSQGIVMLINLFFGLSINAAYGAAVQVQNAVNSFVTSFKSSIVPQIMSSFGANNLSGMHKLINYGTKITFLLLLLVTFPLIFSSQWVLTIWLETPPEHTANLVILVLISINISSFTYFLEQGIHASGKIVKHQLLLSSSFLISILVVYILFNLNFSFYSAIIVNMIIGCLQGGINLYYAKKCFSYPIKPFIRKILIPSLFFVIISYIIFKTESTLDLSDSVKFIIFLFTDLTALPILSYIILFDKNEKTTIKNIIKNKFSKNK